MRRSKTPLPGAEWLGQKGPGYPMVLSCRARLARNIEGLPFPYSADEDDLERVRGMVLEAVARRVSKDLDWEVKFAEELSKEQVAMLAEEHTTTPMFGERTGGRAVAIHPRRGQTVVVNEEDHARIHAVLPGGQFAKVWKIVDGIDNQLESEVQYSFDTRLGYLTSCLSNVGTGLRLSAMLHLPALIITGDIARTIAALGQAGIFVRGLYGEGSGVAGNIFQIANRYTLGRTEEDIVSNLDSVVRQVVDNERTARKMMQRDAPVELADRVYRALGVVERARRMCFFEALELLSLVKLGVEMDLLPIADFNMLEVGASICPYHIKKVIGVEAEEEEVDNERAPHLRRLLGL